MQQRLMDINADTRLQPLDRRVLAYVISHGAHGQGIANAALAAALNARPDSIKRSKRRLRELGYIEVTISTDGLNASVIRLLPGEEKAAREGGVQDAPPFHVSESTCVAETPVVESEQVTASAEVCAADGVPPSGSPASDTRLLVDLKKRESVLRGLLRRGGDPRQVLAWQGELLTIQEVLGARPMACEEPQLIQLGASFVESEASIERDAGVVPDSVAEACRTRLANPGETHPELTDAQLTVLLRDALEAQGNTVLRPLLARVSWHFASDDCVILVCTPRDLAVVTAQLCMASWLALQALLSERSLSVRVQIGQPIPIELRPAWLDESLWVQVPQWLRPQLVGSVVVGGKLYGATAERTADLIAYEGVIGWLLDQAERVSASE